MITNKLIIGGLAFLVAGCSLTQPPIIVPPNTKEETREESVIETPYEEIEPIVETITEPETEVEAIQRGDLLVSIYTDNYKVGDTLDCLVRIQNSRMEDILVQEGDIKLRLMRHEEVKKSDGLASLEVLFKDQGYLEIEYANDNAKVTISNIEATYDGTPYFIPSPLVVSFNRDVDSYIFNEAGTYHIEILAKYFYEGGFYDGLFKGEEFVVK